MPVNKSQIDVFESQLDESIKHFDNEAKYHKLLYRRLRISILTLVFCSTLAASAAGIFNDQAKFLNLIVVASSALTAVLSAIESMRKPGELWILERGTYHALRDLRKTIEFEQATQVSGSRLEDRYIAMQAVLQAAQQQWHIQVSPKSPVKTHQADSHASSDANVVST